MQSTTQHEVDREEKELRPPRAIPVADYHTRTLSISEGKLCDFLLTVTFRTRIYCSPPVCLGVPDRSPDALRSLDLHKLTGSQRKGR
jgi:hypothetical protein